MSEIVPVPLLWIRTIAFAFALIVVSVFFLGRCSANSDALPPAIQADVDRHGRTTAADSARRLELERENARLKAQRDAQIRIARATDSAAMKQRRRADTLQAVALAALTEAEEAKAWHAAHDARKLEADSAEAASAAKDVVIEADSAMLATKDTIIAVEHRGRLQGDSIIAELLPLAQHRDQCSILFGIIKCPTRKQAFVGGVLAGVATYAIATGRIKIPLSLKF